MSMIPLLSSPLLVVACFARGVEDVAVSCSSFLVFSEVLFAVRNFYTFPENLGKSVKETTRFAWSETNYNCFWGGETTNSTT
jgi:hypothetical protein